jgi:hypothetical protein
MSHSVAGHTFDPVVHTNSYQCRDCSLVITDYALFGSVTLPPPCPGPKASAPVASSIRAQNAKQLLGSPLSISHSGHDLQPNFSGSSGEHRCADCGLVTWWTTVGFSPAPGPCPGAPSAPQAIAPPPRMSSTAWALLQEASKLWDEPVAFPPTAPSGPPTCPACDIELCPVIDEFAGVLGPFCARCRR